MGTLWLLDSGALLHFTHDLNDFIEYCKLQLHERIPVNTASNKIYVEGEGSMLLKHYQSNKLVTTCLTKVLHILEITTCLLSIGKFLQQGLHIHGDSHTISLVYKNRLVLTCKPLHLGQMVYWLDAAIAELDANQIYKVDYDLMHRHLGHPSKDVMSQAKNYTKGFPKDLPIPTNTPVCPGCAQGKMPASAHLPSETRATAPFERVHSDLKSFPVV